MAFHIPRSFLNDTHVSLIKKLLKIEPTTKYVPNLSFGCQNNLVTDPVIMYRVVESKDDNTPDIIQLPYSFARALLKIPIPNYHPPASYEFTKKLYPSQVQVADDAITHLKQYGTTTLNLYTGFGKTVLGAYLGAWSKKITLVLYTNTILQPQWLSTFKNFTNARIWVIGEDKEPPKLGPHVILCMSTRVRKIHPNYLKHIGTVVYDEADTFCTPGRLDCLLGITPKYAIAATATLERDDGMENMITAVCGTHTIKKISKKPFIVYKWMTGVIIHQVKNVRGVTDWNKVTLDQSRSRERNLQILSLIRSNMERKILVLTRRKDDHAIPLAKWFSQMGLNVDYMAGTKKNYSDSHVLVGTFSKIGRGFDEKAACDNYSGIRIDLLILVGSVKSVKLLEQLAGRAFRSEFPQIIHFVDECSISKSHWRVASPWYKSRNGQIIDVYSNYYHQNLHMIQNEDTTKQSQLSIVQQQIANRFKRQ